MTRTNREESHLGADEEERRRDTSVKGPDETKERYEQATHDDDDQGRYTWSGKLSGRSTRRVLDYTALELVTTKNSTRSHATCDGRPIRSRTHRNHTLLDDSSGHNDAPQRTTQADWVASTEYQRKGIPTACDEDRRRCEMGMDA